jgi:hypothetical protein
VTIVVAAVVVAAAAGMVVEGKISGTLKNVVV